MSDVAKSLERTPSYPCKYFGCELGAQTTFDEKNDRYIVNGAHETARLQELLDGFIRKFVLCKECDNPETRLSINKKQEIHADCAACGAQYMADMRHKLCTFILKNPPAGSGGGKGDPTKKLDKKARRAAKAAKMRGESAGGADDDSKPTSPTGAQAEKQGKKQANGGALFDVDVPTVADEDVEWSEDTSAEAVAKRRAEVGHSMSHGLKHIQLEDVEDLSDEERLQRFYEYVEAKNWKTDKEIMDYGDMLEVNDRAIGILAELIFSENVIAEMKEHLGLLRHFRKGKKSEKYLLGGLEILLGQRCRDALLKRTAHVLKAFYDVDLLTEEGLLAWAEKPSKKDVKKDVAIELRKHAEKFITWLKEAEEEEDSSEDEEEDEEEEDEEEEEPVAPAPPAPKKVVADITQVAADDDLDDLELDIDNI